MINYRSRSSSDSSKEQKTSRVKSLLIIDQTNVLLRKEQTTYLYSNYLRPPPQRRFRKYSQNPSEWREKICQWAYSLADNCDLSRKTVAISLDLYDRYLATQGNRCDDRLALLTSLATLYIAIKIHEQKKIKLETLAGLSRCQFTADDIEKMEFKILHSLSWFVHPPTIVDFLSLLLKFLPPSVSMVHRHNAFKLSRYMAELSVCDRYFIERTSSTVAFAAISNVLEDEMAGTISLVCRSKYFHFLQEEFGFCLDSAHIRAARDRLRTLVESCGIRTSHEENKENKENLYSRRDSTECSYRTPDDTSLGSKASPCGNNNQKMKKSARSRCNSTDSRSSLGSIGSAGKLFRSNRKGSMVTPC